AVDVLAGCRVVDGDLLALRIDEFAEIALAHFRLGNGYGRESRSAFAVTFISNHEKALIASIVELGNVERSIDLAAVLVQVVGGDGQPLQVVAEGVGVQLLAPSE